MYSVLISNKLIREILPADTKSNLVLSPMEFRVKYLMISLIQKNTEKFEPIDITVPEFARYFGLSWGGEQTKSLVVAIGNLIENSYILDGKTIHWLSPESYISDGKIHLELNGSLAPYLLKIKENFTFYHYGDTVNFKSRYSFRMYEFMKSVEGMGKFLMGTLKDVFYTNLVTKVSALTMKEKIKEMKQRFDSSEHGGAPILGISKPVIKAHGSSDANAIKNAVRQAIHFVDTGINNDITVFAADYDDKKLIADAEKLYGQL